MKVRTKALITVLSALLVINTVQAKTPEAVKIDESGVLEKASKEKLAWSMDILPGVTDTLPHTGDEARDLLMKTICHPESLESYIKSIIERLKHLKSSAGIIFNPCYFRASFDFSQFYRRFSGSMTLNALHYPPRFYLSLPKQVKLKDGKITLNLPIARQLSERNRSGNTIPQSPEETKECFAGRTKDGKCKALKAGAVLADISDFLGEDVAKKTNEQPLKDIIAQESNVTEAIAAGSNVDQIDENTTEVIALRNAYMNAAVNTPVATVVPGKEARNKVPRSVRKKYDTLAYQQQIRDTYLKSFQRRIEIHYQQIIKLKAMIEQVCALPTDTPPIQETTVKKPSGSSSLIGSVVGKAKTEKRKKEEMIASRGLSGAVARKVVSAMKPVIKDALATQTAELSSVIDDSQTATAETLADDGKKTRERIRDELTATRNVEKALLCTQLRLNLERAMIELDNLEATVAVMGTSFSKVQQTEAQTYRKEAEKWFKRGFDH